MSSKNGFSLTQWLVVGALAAGAAGGGIWYWQSNNDKGADYKTAPATRGDLIQTVTATGQLNPMTNVTVGSQVSGNISKLYVDFNSPVTNGQLIAQLDPAIYNAALSQTKGDLANAEAAQELAKVEANRAEELHKSKLISQSDYDKALADLHQADAMVMIKAAARDKAQLDLSHTYIFAPVDGLVISRAVDVGQTVAASMSAPTLFIIANDLTKMQIDALVSEADIGGVKTNQNVNFSVDAFPSRIFNGNVVQIRNAAMTNQNVISYDTVIGVDNSSLDLRPGMTANVSIITDRRNGALKIPNGALRFRPPDAPANTNRDEGGPMFAGGGGNGGGGRGQRGDGGGPGGGGRRGGRGDGSGGGMDTGVAPGARRPRPERQMHTIYVLDKGADGKSKIAKPVQVRTGIGDGISTEVIDGLDEGQLVIVGQNLPSDSASSAQNRPTNPFGGGGRRF
jgi:HlyD family secretion protein